MNNYVQFGEREGQPLIWRVVKINDDGSVLIVTQDNVISKQLDKDMKYYGDSIPICIGTWTNNFANADIKTYLNKEFPDGLTQAQKVLLKSNNWNTSCTSVTESNKICPDGGFTSTIAKVGLLTLNNYLAVAGVGVNKEPTTPSYLVNSNWLLGTGHSSHDFIVWIVNVIGGTGNYYINGESKVRPAVVLNSGITITGDGDGSSDSPYTIE